MSAIANRFDPWGPVSTVLYETNNADLVRNIIGLTGATIEWQPMSRNDDYSHGNRIRYYRRHVDIAYGALPDEQKGQFVQIVVKAMLNRGNSAELRMRLINALADIGWTVSEDGTLKTQDALVSEQFFAPGSEYDAYISIREILKSAQSEIFVVDPYIGSSLLSTLGALAPKKLVVRFLTSEKSLKADFHNEIAAFKKQFPQIELHIRTTLDFHDRFVVIDNSAIYHIGASLKDAGKRAFMISRLEDKPNIESARQRIEEAWTVGKVAQ